jgi:hypothetical protein
MILVMVSAAVGSPSPGDLPGGSPGSSSVVLISTSLNATGIPSSRSRSSTIWWGVRRPFSVPARMRSAGITSIIHAAVSPSKRRTLQTRFLRRQPALDVPPAEHCHHER